MHTNKWIQWLGHLFLSLKGRISRRTYWLGVIILAPVSNTGSWGWYVLIDTANDAGAIACLILYLLTLWPAFALLAKRLHDRDRSAWWLLTLLIPLANIGFGIWLLINTWFLKGTEGPNSFGEDPLTNGRQPT